ncbi:hypothetical protein ILYODFUR_006477 [Ilyodon furcidens]|uniref:Uncharacterized protein n=1 Tax=Ilyodon furcidens TaxID=33524 RepID=A0ABV0U4C4_9TELE
MSECVGAPQRAHLSCNPPCGLVWVFFPPHTDLCLNIQCRPSLYLLIQASGLFDLNHFHFIVAMQTPPPPPSDRREMDLRRNPEVISPSKSNKMHSCF